MSWQKRSIQLIIGLPLTVPVVSYAINIGDTYVQSQQNQPLNASINVSDIDPATFSVKLANSATYQQLGLSNDAKVSVKFEPTSTNGGKIVITSSKPLNAPFTDVVLNVTDKGETKTLPKTLLLPIDDTKQVITQSNTQLVEVEPKSVTVGSQNPVNLPVVSEPTPITTNEPVVTTTVTPATSSEANFPLAANTVTPATTTQTGEPLPILKGSLDTSKNLIITETRRPVGSNSDTIIATKTTESAEEEKPVTATADKPKTPEAANTVESSEDTQSSQEMVTYVIQRNDNLWTIANQLAKQNKTDVNKVMKDIVAANPRAFENNDPSKLVVNSELQVPKYKVMPSQLGIKSANAVKKQTRTTIKKPTTKTTSKATVAKQRKATTTSKKPVVARQRPKAAVKPANRPVKARRTEMKIIAPSQSNGSTQGAIKADKNVGKNAQASQIVTQVQQKRQVTAQQASKVGKLNQSLVSAEKRLKLQNAKLAQLEERLKELNKK